MAKVGKLIANFSLIYVVVGCLSHSSTSLPSLFALLLFVDA